MIIDRAVSKVETLSAATTFYNDDFEERFSQFDGKLHKFVYQFLHNLPGPNKQVSGIIFCGVLTALIYWFDIIIGNFTSAIALFLIPLLIGAFYFDRGYVYINTVFIAIVATMSLRDGVFSGQQFPFFLTFFFMIIGFGLTAQFVLMLKTLIRGLLEHVEDLDDDLKMLKKRNERDQKDEPDA
jgi:hypothetical protein